MLSAVNAQVTVSRKHSLAVALVRELTLSLHSGLSKWAQALYSGVAFFLFVLCVILIYILPLMCWLQVSHFSASSYTTQFEESLNRTEMLVCSSLGFQGFPAVNLENTSNPTEAFFRFFDMKDRVVICVQQWSLWDTNQWLGAVWFEGKGKSFFAISGLENEGSKILMNWLEVTDPKSKSHAKYHFSVGGRNCSVYTPAVEVLLFFFPDIGLFPVMNISC